jgi:hypothetical protein
MVEMKRLRIGCSGRLGSFRGSVYTQGVQGGEFHQTVPYGLV